MLFNALAGGICAAAAYLGVVFHTTEAISIGVIGFLFFFFKR
jgi:hypothetical protein